MKQKADYWYYSSLVLSIWFLMTSWLWFFLINLVVSFPAGLLGLLLYFIGKKKSTESEKYKKILHILISGFILSFVLFFTLYLYAK